MRFAPLKYWGAPLLLGFLAACGPRAQVPPVPVAPLPGELVPGTPGRLLAGSLAPVLYLQRDETFQLTRAIAVVHPDSQVIAYHLLWRDDAHGAWIPGTVPTDQEIVWVGYDSTGAPTELWTYWHGNVLHTPWHGRQPAVDVQWGKHGSLPRGAAASLPRAQSLGVFYLFAWALPDFWLSRVNREGPLCFCHGPRRYEEFTTPLLLAPRLDAVFRTADPDPALAAVFGENYSRKRHWPWG